MDCETLSVLFDKQIRQAVFFVCFRCVVTHNEESQKCSDNTKPKRLVYSLIRYHILIINKSLEHTDLWN